MSELHNLDAEQAVLGAVLFDNGLADRLGELVDAASFYDPVHGRIWSRARELIDRGETADPIALKLWAQTDQGLLALGGTEYLVGLFTGAPTAKSATGYARYVAELAARRALLNAGETVARMAADPDATADDMRAWLEDTLSAAFARGAGSRLVSMTTACTAAVQAVADAMETGYPPGTILTGLETLDDALGGLRPAHHTLIAADSSIGKSLLMNRIAIGAANGAGDRQRARVLYVTPEMAASENVIRMAAARINAAYSRLERADWTHDGQADEFRDAMRHLAGLPITWREGGGFTPADIARLVRAEMRWPTNPPLGLVIVDPIGFIRAPGEDETARTSAVAEALQSLAAETKLPVASTHHMRKLEKGSRPTDESIRGSRRLFDYANEVVILHRDSYYAQKEPEPEDPEKAERWKRRCEALEMEFLVAKRRGGGLGWRKLGCNVATGRFWDLDDRRNHWEAA